MFFWLLVLIIYRVVSNRWTGLLDWNPKKDVRLACKTACVVETSASQGHTDIAEPGKRGARFTITLNKATNYTAKLAKPIAQK